MQGKTALLTIVAPKAIHDWLTITQALTELHLPFELNFFSSEELPTLDWGQFTFSLALLSHRGLSGGNDSPELIKIICTDSNILVHKPTYTKDMTDKAAKVGHSYAKQVVSFAEQASVPNLILTHFSPRYHSEHSHTASISEIYLEACPTYSGNLQLVSDFNRFQLDKAGN